jgi:hypothetical protein
MRYYGECLYCRAPLYKVANVRNAFCDSVCKNGYRDWKRENKLNKSGSKKFNQGAVREYVQAPLFILEAHDEKGG